MAAFLDNCKFTPTAGGTTDWTYSAAATGYQSPAAAGVVNGEKYKYLAISADLTQWEIGEGAYNTSTGVLPRTSVLYNSSGTGIAAGQSGAGSKISFTLVPNVAVVGVKEDLLAFDEASSFSATQKNQAQKNLGLPAVLPGYLYGLTLSTAGSSSSFGVASGVATDGTAADFMSLSSAFTKTTSAWSAGSGNGALDTGTIAVSTWYWVFLVKNVSTQAVDVLITKAVAATTPSPTLPSGYTLYRYIGSMLTNGSSQWTSFNQFGSTFYWTTAVTDVANGSPSSNTDVTQTLTVPLGVRVRPILRTNAISNTVNAADIAIRSPDLMSAEATPQADTTNGPLPSIGVTIAGSTITRIGGDVGVPLYTNTSGQIVYRAYYPSGGASSVSIRTYGWVDERGAGVVSGGGSPVASQQLAPFMRSYLAGLTLSTAGSSTTFSVAAGTAADSTNTDMMTFSASISKTTSAWAAGSAAGSLDTGTIAASTWYHAYLIKNESTGAVDVLVSLSASSPTLPSGYTLFRRIGSMKTNSSSQWTKFVQDGDEFLWSAPTTGDISVSIGTSPTNVTTNVPSGVQVWAIVNGLLNNGTVGTQIGLYSPDNGTPSSNTSFGWTVSNTSTGVGTGIAKIRTDTSQHIVGSSNVASSSVNATTFGWVDRRGRDN